MASSFFINKVRVGWRYELTVPRLTRKGWRPTRALAKRAALREYERFDFDDPEPSAR